MDTEDVTVERGSLDVLERGDWVYGETQGDAIRVGGARAALLDCLLRDEDVVGEVVTQLNRITLADQLVDEIETTFARIREVGCAAGVFTADHRTGERDWRQTPKAVQQRVAGLHSAQNELSNRLFVVVTGADEKQSRAMIECVTTWLERWRMHWPWLIHDIVRWYREKVMYLNPHGGWAARYGDPRTSGSSA
jgi:hypothetical protein